MTKRPRVLVVRLGAMGDIIHTLPALATLQHGFPEGEITWAVDPRWNALFDPTVRTLRWQDVRGGDFDFALDFQGLIKSGTVARYSGAPIIYGFKKPREWPAHWFYHRRVATDSVHMVDQNIDLSIGAGARERRYCFPVGGGRAEGRVPEGRFVLASPFAGWGAKQWPLENYSALGEMLGRELGIPLVLNAATETKVEHTASNVSGVPGLIAATRQASAVVGVDSGPLHLAAALGKSGVAIYGPTDPARNGPFGGHFTVLRAGDAVTDHKRAKASDRSMLAITARQVFDALRPGLVR